MTGKYNDSPINKFYKLLLHGIKNRESKTGELDAILALILLNNGCKKRKHSIQFQVTYDIVPGEYKLCFVSNMIGNDANEFYDFLTFDGLKYLIIFTDYFEGIIKEGEITEDDPLYSLKVSMGNSVYYDAIKRIVEVYYLTSEPIPGGLLTTAMATTQRWNQAIIAIHILNNFKPIDENDVSDISMEDVKNILEGSPEMQLYGIRAM